MSMSLTQGGTEEAGNLDRVFSKVVTVEKATLLKIANLL